MTLRLRGLGLGPVDTGTPDVTGTVVGGGYMPCCQSADPAVRSLDPAMVPCDPNCITTDTGNPNAQLSQQIYTMQGALSGATSNMKNMLLIGGVALGALFLLTALKR